MMNNTLAISVATAKDLLTAMQETFTYFMDSGTGSATSRLYLFLPQKEAIAIYHLNEKPPPAWLSHWDTHINV
jgi:hypothetical protein